VVNHADLPYLYYLKVLWKFKEGETVRKRKINGSRNKKTLLRRRLIMGAFVFFAITLSAGAAFAFSSDPLIFRGTAGVDAHIFRSLLDEFAAFGDMYLPDESVGGGAPQFVPPVAGPPGSGGGGESVITPPPGYEPEENEPEEEYPNDSEPEKNEPEEEYPDNDEPEENEPEEEYPNDDLDLGENPNEDSEDNSNEGESENDSSNDDINENDTTNNYEQ